MAKISSVATAVRNFRKQRGLTQRELASKLNTNRATLANWETGRAQPSPGQLVSLAEFFQVSVDELVGHDPGAKVGSRVVSLPLLSGVRAGTAPEAEENCTGMIDVPIDWDADLAIRVSSDSMSWGGINPGDIAALQRTEAVKNGMIVAAYTGDRDWKPRLSYYIEENDRAILRAANPSSADRELTSRHRILGAVVGILKWSPDSQGYQTRRISQNPKNEDWADVIRLAEQLGISSSEVAQLITMFAKTTAQLNSSKHNLTVKL